MAKRNVVARTYRSTRKTLGRYLSSGEKSAEATIEQLLDVLGEARTTLRKLAGGRKRKTGGGRRKKVTKRRTVKRPAKRKARRKAR